MESQSLEKASARVEKKKRGGRTVCGKSSGKKKNLTSRAGEGKTGNSFRKSTNRTGAVNQKIQIGLVMWKKTA